MATRGTSAWRKEFWGPGCDESVIVKAYWYAGLPKIECHRDGVGYFRALGRVLRRHHYVVRADVTGCYVCRAITGGTAPSAHAQGIAIDMNWDTNPYRLDKLVTDMPRPMIEEGEAIVTLGGVKAGRWGGDWDGRPETAQGNYDSMHWEMMITPEEARAGFDSPAFDEEDRWTWPLLAHGEQGNAVRQLQGHIAAALGESIEADGQFGPTTESLVKRYQESRGLGVDGVVSLGTWTALFSDQPPVAPGGVKPSKAA